MRRYYIKTYGCQMNVADSAKLADVLREYGYREVGSEEEADLILVNTCVVRQGAEDRAAWHVTSLKGVKKSGVLIGLCGCMVTEPGRDVKKDFPHVDFFIPPHNTEKLRRILATHSPKRPSPAKAGEGGPSPQAMVSEVFITIMTGCNNYCSYCVVPYVRGPETSRAMDEVLAEVEQAIKAGAQNITLLGQNVNAYKYGLATLLNNINPLIHSRLPSPVFRFLTSHPRDMSDEIIEAVATLPYVDKEVIMPLQSGDDRVLKAMNRGYDLDYYRGRVSRLRSLVPGIRIISDLIVGFPGETEAEFERTLRAVEEFKFTVVNMFAYSGRPETAASRLPGQLPEEVIKARLQRLIATVRGVIKKLSKPNLTA
ncbi:MAG: MiaB/RimO family radical SAM methylthiotransferase [Candidatus Margulisbacteria bacterium]|nr:MiaB/RimO family radical SAM methylthiotransferase [Candidatus Margulisiibacteriota bacterium]